MEQRTVAGEDLELLRSAFANFKHRKRSDGMIELTGRLEPELGEPILRALSRIETELLDLDATYGDADMRTTSQRRADAFVLLAERLTAALDRS